MTEWSHGFLGCFDDCSVCKYLLLSARFARTVSVENCMLSRTGLLTFLAPCYIVGKNAEAVDKSCFLHCLAFYVPLLNWYCIANVRGEIRDRHGIEVSINWLLFYWRLIVTNFIQGSFIKDCLLSLCVLCALTQMNNVSCHEWCCMECHITDICKLCHAVWSKTVNTLTYDHDFHDNNSHWLLI